MQTTFAVTLGACLAALPAVADCTRDKDPMRFAVTQGVVVDGKSGLSWTLCPIGQSSGDTGCSGTALVLPWNDADAHAATLDGNWRLPKLEELETLLSDACDAPVWPSAFNLPATQIWTASPGFPVNDVAAIVDTTTGEVFGTGKGVARAFVLVSGAIDPEY